MTGGLAKRTSLNDRVGGGGGQQESTHGSQRGLCHNLRQLSFLVLPLFFPPPPLPGVDCPQRKRPKDEYGEDSSAAPTTHSHRMGTCGVSLSAPRFATSALRLGEPALALTASAFPRLAGGLDAPLLVVVILRLSPTAGTTPLTR